VKALWLGLALGLFACGFDPSAHQDIEGSHPPLTDTSGHCPGICDASPPSYPSVDTGLSFGDITTYGSVDDPAPSQGGACNYGTTGIYAFAAINVHEMPGDLQGQWDGGHFCGQCLEVSLRSETGWKTAIVRVMDKCADAHCGVDLGGAPAKVLMGDKPGRYSGKWKPVQCPVRDDLFDGPPSLFIKEGSNAFWALAQVRNAAERVTAIRWRKAEAPESGPWTEASWAAEAENFYRLPSEILQDTALYEWRVEMPSGREYRLKLKGAELAEPSANWPLSEG